MTSNAPQPAPRPRARFGNFVIIALLAFLGGAFALGWAQNNWPNVRAWIGQSDAVTTGGPDAMSNATSPPIPETPLDVGVDGAAGNRLEGLMLVQAARRALDQGQDLGGVAQRLATFFADSRPDLVRILVAETRGVPTRETLRQSLEALRSQLMQSQTGGDMLSQIGDFFQSLIIIRRADQPNNKPGTQFDQALRLVETGNVEQAMAIVRSAPNAAVGREWLAKAGQYVRVRKALDMLETSALNRPEAVMPNSPPLAPPENAVAPPSSGAQGIF